MRYIIFAYKPDSCNTARGCVLDSYGSDFEMLDTFDQEKAVDFLTKLMVRNLTLNHGEAAYDIFVVGEIPEDTAGCPPEFIIPEEWRWAEERALDIIQAAKAAEVAAKAAEEEEKSRREKEWELATLQRLSLKYKDA